jgi:hypothetical protein
MNLKLALRTAENMFRKYVLHITVHLCVIIYFSMNKNGSCCCIFMDLTMFCSKVSVYVSGYERTSDMNKCVHQLVKSCSIALPQGSRVSRALAEAMLTVQHTKHFAHPTNWAGFMLVGADVRLSNKVALMGQALCELLKNPEKCRDALRVTLHLVS